MSRATVKDVDLRIDKEGILNYLKRLGFSNTDVEKGMEEFLWANKVIVNSDGVIESLVIQDVRYYENQWKEIAPFLSGYIEWIGDDDEQWRDWFKDGKMKTEYPEVIWPSECFYIETWCDEDIALQMREFLITEDNPDFDNILNEAKIRVSRSFDDKSYRIEQIEQIISDILREKTS